MSFKDAWKDTEESVINKYDRKEPQIRHEHRNRREHKENKSNNAKYAPFAEIEHHNQSDEEPVYKLQQPEGSKKNAVIVGAKQ